MILNLIRGSKIKYLLPEFLLLASLFSKGQTTEPDCKKILDKEPYFMHRPANLSKDSVQLDMDILRRCGNLDSIDNELLKGSVLGTLLVELATKSKVVTYRDILNSINQFKKGEDYLKFRETIIISKTLERKIVTREELEKDKELLAKVGMPGDEIEKFKLFIDVNADEQMTYKEAFEKFISSRPSYLTSKSEKKILEFEDLIDVDHAIKVSVKKNKKVLIYFTCYACVNARKMEDFVLTDERVKMILTQKYSYFAAYVDAKNPDSKSHLTVGQKYQKLQSEKFKSSYQPYFYVIDDGGNVISEIGYTNKPQDFIDFLNKGLNQKTSDTQK